MTLYELVNKITKEGYIGITHRIPKKRWQEHIYGLRSGKHGNIRLQNAFNKYGESTFEFKIRETFDSLEKLNKAEKEVLEEEKDRLYNLAPGGNAFYHYLESKQKISKNQLKPVVGMSIKTGEIREYPSVMGTNKDGFDPKGIGGACKLYKYESEFRSYNKLSNQGWVWMYKKDFNIEELELRRQKALRGKIRLERSVLGKSLETGEIVKFNSVMDAKREGFNNSCIRRACHAKGSKHKGFVWVYGDIDSPESLLEERHELLCLKRNKIKKIIKPLLVSVIGMNIDTKEIKKYTCLKDTAKDGFSPACVGRVANKRMVINSNGYQYTILSHKNWIWSNKIGVTYEELLKISEIAKSSKRRNNK